MALIETDGGKYENLATDDEFCDVIAREISPEFAQIIRQKITDENDKYEDLKSDLDYEAADNNARYEALQMICNLARDAARTVKRMDCEDKKKIIAAFEEIEREAYKWIC